jgi:hypothetical protein
MSISAISVSWSDGREVLFDRGYVPIYERYPGRLAAKFWKRVAASMVSDVDVAKNVCLEFQII